jgi:hypothetical protein
MGVKTIDILSEILVLKSRTNRPTIGYAIAHHRGHIHHRKRTELRAEVSTEEYPIHKLSSFTIIHFLYHALRRFALIRGRVRIKDLCLDGMHTEA